MCWWCLVLLKPVCSIPPYESVSMPGACEFFLGCIERCHDFEQTLPGVMIQKSTGCRVAHAFVPVFSWAHVTLQLPSEVRGPEKGGAQRGSGPSEVRGPEKVYSTRKKYCKTSFFCVKYRCFLPLTWFDVVV